jgi:intracellular multiplication protein IcmP
VAHPMRNDVQADNDWTMAAVGMLITLMAAALFFRQLTIECTTSLLYRMWNIADFGWFHPYAGWRINLLAETHNNAETVSWSVFISVMNATGSILLAALLPLVITGIISVRRHQVSRTRRDISIQTLPRIMSSFSPAIIPALAYGDRKTQLLNVDPEEHRSAQTPEEFAIDHKLVVNHRLQRDLTEQLFVAQLGNPLKHPPPDDIQPGRLLPEFEQFNDHEKAMFAIFGLQFFLNKRREAELLIDELNRSTLKIDHAYRNKIGYPNLSLAEAAFQQVACSHTGRAWLRQYGYVRTAIAALHDNDLHLPIRRYRWLKGLDRTLWYALASTGRPRPFVEGAGVVTQSHWEKLSAQHRVRLSRPIMSLALDGLETDLRGIGAITDEDIPYMRSSEYANEEKDDGHSPVFDQQNIHRHQRTSRPRMR